MGVARAVVTNTIPCISSEDLTDVVTIKTRASNVFLVLERQVTSRFHRLMATSQPPDH